MDEKKVRLTKVQERQTFLITFYAKVLDSRAENSILKDRFAGEAARRLDFDFRQLRMPKGADITTPMRAWHLDTWTREFLAAHPDATVLQLGPGLDSRVFRIDPPPTVRWYEIDQPDVIALRRELYPERPGCTLIGSSVTDLRWLDVIPADKPVLVVAEGVVMYLTEQDGVALFTRLRRQFPSGQLIFDAYSRFVERSLMFVTWLQRNPVRLHWPFGDPRKLEARVPGLRLLTAQPFLLLPELADRLKQNAVQRWIGEKLMRRSIQHLRYEF